MTYTPVSVVVSASREAQSKTGPSTAAVSYHTGMRYIKSTDTSPRWSRKHEELLKISPLTGKKTRTWHNGGPVVKTV